MTSKRSKGGKPPVRAPKPAPPAVEARSAETGRWVSMWYAICHPRTTVVERRARRKAS